MKVLFVASEVTPFAKSGGLGDVSAALPRALRGRGHDVRIVLPMYSRVEKPGRTFEPVVKEAQIDLGGLRVIFSIWRATLPDTDVPVYFVRCPSLYDRPSIYTQDPDEHLRFIVLCWASLVLCQRLGFAPDIVHANDWQTALLPLLLRTSFGWDRLFERTRTVLTIHNIGHQGGFDAGILPQTGMANDAHLFHQDFLREGRVNFLLTGILYANAITTVSPTYAREIQTPEHGVGLDAFLRSRRDVLFGVLNGIDEAEWDPATDKNLPAHYTAEDLSGKERCKESLLAAANLPYIPNVPLIGIVSRLVWQKGFELCFSVLPQLFASRAVQMVVLGTGEPQYEALFHGLARRFRKQVTYRPGFSEPLAHQIEAGSDFFLMPSRYEPCGLNQMYSLRYGTPPIVHRTGGLADTVSPFDARRERGTGFVFNHFDEGGLRYGLGAALSAFGQGRPEDRARMATLQRNGMRQRFGWDERIGSYEAIYKMLVP